MTIVQIRRSHHKVNLFLILIGIVIIAAFWGVYNYNQLVNLRHEIIKRSNDLERIEVSNAELKNSLYLLTDVKNLQKIASERGLIIDKNPQYIVKESLAISHQ
jgi:cell division protein FtsL